MLPYKGKPMLQHNLEKCLDMFERVYVSSDSDEILDFARSFGAIGIKRGKDLCGETPDIPVYQHALKHMLLDGEVSAVVAVHVDTPDIPDQLIDDVALMLEIGYEEVMTCHPMEDTEDYHNRSNRVFGSVRGLSCDRLMNYGDPYKPQPDVLLVDETVEIQTPEDYKKYCD
jgi:CMP-N-acetylneuraminic acid synthetase